MDDLEKEELEALRRLERKARAHDASGRVAPWWAPEFEELDTIRACPTCNGSGLGPFDHKGRCLACGGTGKRQ